MTGCRDRGPRGHLVAALVALAALASPALGVAPAAACPDHPALVVGERLDFEISWVGIPAGHATLAIEEKIDVGGRPALRLVSTAASNDVVDVFYKVRDRAESVIDCEGRHSLRFTLRAHEGRRRRERDYTFDLIRREATFGEPGRKVQRFPLQEPVQDPLSSLYFVRTQPLEVGRSLLLRTFEGGRLWELEVEVLRRERVAVPAGRFDTIVVKPHLKFEGVFQQKGDVVVWLTDDPQRVPIRMQSKVKIGSVAAELTSHRIQPGRPGVGGGAPAGQRPAAAEVR